MQGVMDDFLKIKFNIKKNVKVEDIARTDIKALIKEAREATITPPKIEIKSISPYQSRDRLRNIVKNIKNSRSASKMKLEEIEREKYRLKKMK
jgi:hypothetical protein